MTDHRLRGPRRIIASIGLGLLTFSQLIIGGWALFVPAGFFAAFPSSGHAWVALLPPYNEHLVRDVGALSLSLAVVLLVAAVTADRLLIRVGAIAFTVYALPHTVFHGLHLHGFSLVDAVAQMAGFVLQLGLVIVILAATLQPSADRGIEPTVRG